MTKIYPGTVTKGSVYTETRKKKNFHTNPERNTYTISNSALVHLRKRETVNSLKPERNNLGPDTVIYYLLRDWFHLLRAETRTGTILAIIAIDNNSARS